MNQRAIRDITDFIFMKDVPQKSDIIFIPGTSQSAVTETAARLYCAGYAGYVGLEYLPLKDSDESLAALLQKLPLGS